MNDALGKAFPTGLTVNLNLLLWPQHQPAFPDSCAGVGPKLRAIKCIARYAYLNQEASGVRVFCPKICFLPLNDSNIWFWFGVPAGNGLLRSEETIAG